jgi:hypothetical protein
MKKLTACLSVISMLCIACIFVPVKGPPPKEVVVIGDSNSSPHPLADKWPEFLDQNSRKLEVLNIACPATTIRDWTPTLSSFPNCNGGENNLLPNTPDYDRADIFIMLGTNDSGGFAEDDRPFLNGPVSPPEYKLHMQATINYLLENGDRHIYLISPPPRGGSTSTEEIQQNLDGYRIALQELAIEFVGVTFGPDAHLILDLDIHFTPDKIHLNEEGHRFLAELAENALVFQGFQD